MSRIKRGLQDTHDVMEKQEDFQNMDVNVSFQSENGKAIEIRGKIKIF
jgi:hypothetical protein